MKLANVLQKAKYSPNALARSRQHLSEAENSLVDMLAELTSKQRKYVSGVIAGKSNKDAYIEAGYTTRTYIPSMINRIMSTQLVADAIMLGHVIHQMKNGVDTYYKRDKAIKIVETCSDPESEQYNANTAITALKYLSDLDGDIQSKHNINQPSGGVQILIQTGIPDRGGATSQILEHNDNNTDDITRQES